MRATRFFHVLGLSIGDEADCILKISEIAYQSQVGERSVALKIPKSGAPVNIIEAHDVVFSQVFTALHLDHHQRQDAGVGDAMLMTCGDVGGLVSGDHGFAFSVDHLGHAADHDPVFAAVMVHLQAEAGAGLDGDPLDFVALTFFQHGVVAPGAVHGAVHAVQFVVICLEGVVQVLDVLRTILRGYEQSVGRVDDDETVHAHGANQAIFTTDVAILGFMQQGLALHAVAVGVGFVQLTQRGPGADVAPADVAGHHRDAIGFFHHGVVDGVFRHGAEVLGVQFALQHATAA